MTKVLVLLPIMVPTGKFCWDMREDGNHEICEHFDNEGGHPHCSFHMYGQKRTPDGSVLKSPDCPQII